MREIVLDTVTTGFEPTEGHRIVEIGAVELFNHLPTGRTYHQYINPKRAMPTAAFEVHGGTITVRGFHFEKLQIFGEKIMTRNLKLYLFHTHIKR